MCQRIVYYATDCILSRTRLKHHYHPILYRTLRSFFFFNQYSYSTRLKFSKILQIKFSFGRLSFRVLENTTVWGRQRLTNTV